MESSYNRRGLPLRRGRPPRAYTSTDEFFIPSSEFESRRGHRGRGRGFRGRGSEGGRFANRSYEGLHETETESLAINADRAVGHFVVDLNSHQGQGERVDKDFLLTRRTNRGTYAAYLSDR